MPNFNPNTKGLRPNPHTLGVEKLEEGEVSKPVRVRASETVHRQLAQLSAKQIGELLEEALQHRQVSHP